MNSRVYLISKKHTQQSLGRIRESLDIASLGKLQNAIVTWSSVAILVAR